MRSCTSTVRASPRSGSWIFVSRRSAVLPELVNRDGEALLFGEVRFQVTRKHRSEIEAALDAAHGWERSAMDPQFWTWIGEGQARSAPTGALSIRSETEDGQPILGTAELQDDALVFTTNSRKRTERGKGVLESLLAAWLGKSVTSYQSPEAILAHSGDAMDEGPDTSDPLDLDDETKQFVIAQAKDRHYRRTLDEPVPALGDKSPRACARSKRHRGKVVAWLKDLENNELQAAGHQDLAAYDVSWIWEELGLGEFRF